MLRYQVKANVKSYNEFTKLDDIDTLNLKVTINKNNVTSHDIYEATANRVNWLYPDCMYITISEYHLLDD